MRGGEDNKERNGGYRFGLIPMKMLQGEVPIFIVSFSIAALKYFSTSFDVSLIHAKLHSFSRN